EAQGGNDALGRLGARDVITLDADRVGGEGEADRGDTREGRGRGAVRREAVGRVGQVPEVVEGARLDRVEERGGHGWVEGDRWGGGPSEWLTPHPARIAAASAAATRVLRVMRGEYRSNPQVRATDARHRRPALRGPRNDTRRRSGSCGDRSVIRSAAGYRRYCLGS